MTREEIYAAARRQSAVDLGCAAEDFLREDNVVVLSRPDPGARRYLTLPFSCQLVTYGGNIVASVSPELREPVEAYLAGIPVRYCAFETPKLLELDEALRPFGQRVCFMAEYFLPEPDAPAPPGCPYELRLLYPGDFAPLYTALWEPMTKAAVLSVWPAARPTVRICGRSAWMCSRVTAAGDWARLLRGGSPRRSSAGARSPSTARPGRISDPCVRRSAAATARPGSK